MSGTRAVLCALLLAVALPPGAAAQAPPAAPVRLAIAGLTHGHVHGILAREKKGDVEIVGIAERNGELARRYAAHYGVPPSLLDWPLAASSEGRPLRWASTSRAHSRPSAMAQTTSDCPRRMSPAVKTPSREVR